MKKVMGLFYKKVESLQYGYIECYKQESSSQTVLRPFRRSSPFVVWHEYGGKKVVIGSVYQTLKDIRYLIWELSESSQKYVAELERDKSKFFNFARYMTNQAILISSQTRNVFHTFSKLSQKFPIPLFTYEGHQDGEVRVKELLDLFVHNRYVFFDGEYIIDLFSETTPKTQAISSKLMGYKFKLNDYIGAIQDAINSLTMNDLTGLLRGRLKRLDVDSSQEDIVFLVQNVESFSELLEAKIPTEKYKFMLRLLFDQTILNSALLGSKRSTAYRVAFHAPHIKIKEDLGQRKFRISVRCDLGGNVNTLKDPDLVPRTVEVGYEEFFDKVNKAFGCDRLLGPFEKEDV